MSERTITFGDGDWICPECTKHHATLEALDSCFRSHYEKSEVKTMAKDEASKKPVKKVRVHGVTLTFWENQGENGAYLTCGIERSYKDKKGEWQTSNSYTESDLNNLALAVREGQHYASIEYPLSKKDKE